MTSAPSGPLAKIAGITPAGSRLKFLPHPSLELGSAVSIWLRAAVALAVPAAVMVSLFAVFFGGVANWLLFVAITAGVFFVVIFTTAMAFQVHRAWSRYRSLELRTAVTPARVAVVGGWFGRRSQVIPSLQDQLSPTRTVTLYDPGTAFEVAQELHAQRSTKSKT
jgi:hypothetical protein